MRYRYRYPFQQPESNKALLLIPEAVVLECERGPGKHFVRINEVDAMVLEVLQALRLVPFEPHLQSVYTEHPGRNRRVSCCQITSRISGALTTISFRHFIHIASAACGSYTVLANARQRLLSRP